jgi:hypothetical protein
MAKELKDLGDEYRKATQNSFAEVVRAAGEIHRGFQGIASEMTEQSKRSVGRALELQTRIAKKTYDAYASEVAKLGQMMFSGYQTFLTRGEEQLPNVGRQSRSVRPRTAAQRASPSRKTGTPSRRKSPPKTRASQKNKRSR